MILIEGWKSTQNMNDIQKTSNKHARHAVIREILNTNASTTQEGIKDYLYNQGIKTSQSTLSRDLREIGAVKIPVNGGKTFYKLGAPLEELVQTISNYSIRYEAIGNFLIIKTTPGNAPGFCVILDRLGWNEIAGTIAGDDTILVISRSPADVKSIITKLDSAL